MSDQIKRIVNEDYTVKSGAYAVADSKYSMTIDEFGEYKYDKDGLASTEKSKLELVCSMSHKSYDEDKIAKELFRNTDDIKHNQVIGYYLNLYAGHVIEGDYRKNASSGGFATWIFKELLVNKHIDGVIHVKASSAAETLFEYGVSTTVEEICEGSKTKYYPVEFSKALNKVKKLPGKYAIIGIPSFITELRLLAMQDKTIDNKIKYTIGLICGHQKSSKYTEALAWQYGIKPGDLRDINYRKKIPNKSSSDYSIEMTGTINGKLVKKTVNQNNFFVSNWGHGFFKTKFSDFTDDAMNETADISLGDAWLPEYVTDEKGNNILIVRNKEIQRIINNGLKEGKIKLDALSVNDIIRSQKGLIRHTRDALPYRLYKLDRTQIWRPKKRIQASNKLPYIRKKVQNIRKDIAEQSHLIYREAVIRDDWMFFEKKMQKYVNRYDYAYKLLRIQEIGTINTIKKISNRSIRKFQTK